MSSLLSPENNNIKFKNNYLWSFLLNLLFSIRLCYVLFSLSIQVVKFHSFFVNFEFIVPIQFEKIIIIILFIYFNFLFFVQL